MLARIYLIIGAILLSGLAAMMFRGWEFGSSVRGAAPAPGTQLRASRSGGWSTHSSNRSGGWWIIGGK